MNRFVIAEPSKCIGCRTCEVACVLAHPLGNGANPLSPENFKPRLKLVKNKDITAPVQCRHCVDAPCVQSCPTGALHYDQNTVQVTQEFCIGCQTCVLACPFGVMEVISVPIATADLGTASSNATAPQAHKCDLCINTKEGPACIPVCPTNALHLIEPIGLENLSSERRENSAASMNMKTK